ncbi:hypothetical protein GCM10018790_17580 [Kitasatospora xanthocidica]|nr:hypothetical protein GCM10018790_17580 [Kitasatospora xanthocidica]
MAAPIGSRAGWAPAGLRRAVRTGVVPYPRAAGVGIPTLGEEPAVFLMKAARWGRAVTSPPGRAVRPCSARRWR